MLLTLWYHFIFSNIVVVTCTNNKHILVNCESWSHWCGEWVAVALVGQVCILLQTDNHQWCSGKYLFGGTHGERGARAYNGGLGAEPPAGCPWVQGQSPWWGVRGRSPPPEVEKVLRFGHAMETANLPYKLQLSVFWKLGKPLLFVISLQNWGAIAAVESRCKATLFTPGPILRNFSGCTISKVHVWCNALTLSKVSTS